MALQSMTALASITLQEASASVSFTSIPQNYRDLVLITNHTGSASVEDVDITINNDTGANYTRVVMYGNSAPGTGSFSNTSRSVSAIYGSNRHGLIMNLIDSSATDKHKILLYRNNNAGQSETVASATRWANTAAISSLALTARTGTFSTGSTFDLYGRIG